MIRQIIRIDEEKCNGCGICATACHEGAIDIIDGKAKLTREHFCDGFGDCLPVCPTGAISFEEREAPEYDESAVKRAQEQTKQKSESNESGCPGSRALKINRNENGCPGSRALKINRNENGCPGSKVMKMNRNESESEETEKNNNHFAKPISHLSNWPVQIKLAPLKADYFDRAELLIAADCTAYAYATFHEDFIKGKVALIGCPKLDAIDYSEKLTEIIANNDIQSVTIVRMEVPCCGGLENATKMALQGSGKFIPWQIVTVGIDGKIIK